MVLSPALAERQVVSSSERLVSQQEVEPTEEEGPVSWSETEGEELKQGIRLRIQHPKVGTNTTDCRCGSMLPMTTLTRPALC